MKLLILAINKNAYSIKRLVEEAHSAGLKVEVINPLHCFMDLSSENFKVLYKKRKLDDFDLILPRVSSSVNYYGVSILRQFEMMGKTCLNTSDAIERARNKLKSMQILSQKGLPMPKSSFANSTEQTQKLAECLVPTGTIQ